MRRSLKSIAILAPTLMMMASCASKPAPVVAVAQPPQVCQNLVDTLVSLDQKASYALGLEIGSAFKGLDMNHVDLDAFSQGLRDTLLFNKALLNAEEASAVKREFFELLQKEAADAEKQKGEAYRAEWLKNNPDAVKTESGLLYKVVAAGGEQKAALGDEVAVHYSGKLIDGTEFDSSHRRNAPFLFELTKGMVIDGWTEMLQLMGAGTVVQVVIPPELGYGERDMRVIPANATLTFDIELIAINPTKEQAEALAKGEPLPAVETAVVDSAAAETAPVAEEGAAEAKPAEAAKPAAAPAKPATEADKPAAAPAKPAAEADKPAP